MNQLDILKSKQAITSAKKKMNQLTREAIKNTDEQQKELKKNEYRNQRMNLRSNFKQQKPNLVQDKQLWQMAKKRERFSRQMREQIEREL